MMLSLKKKSSGSRFLQTDAGAARDFNSIGRYMYSRPRPPGISNTANNCYASSIMHCLQNHPAFMNVALSIITGEHQLNNCTECKETGTVQKLMNNMIV